MVHLVRALLAALLVGVVGCNGAPPKPPVPPEPVGATRTAMYGAGASQAHDAVVGALQGLGEKLEEDRGDGRFVQSISGERPDRSRIRTRVWISAQPEGGTRVTVRRSVVKLVRGQEVEWTSLPTLPEAGDEVLASLDRRLERASGPRR